MSFLNLDLPVLNIIPSPISPLHKLENVPNSLFDTLEPIEEISPRRGSSADKQKTSVSLQTVEQSPPFSVAYPILFSNFKSTVINHPFVEILGMSSLNPNKLSDSAPPSIDESVNPAETVKAKKTFCKRKSVLPEELTEEYLRKKKAKKLQNKLSAARSRIKKKENESRLIEECLELKCQVKLLSQENEIMRAQLVAFKALK